ncbi:hypothetical protein AEYBE204_17500 [Asticcacaulis sp. YBE204]|nr:hypothetical protein AEYBE204_17500 [Asticcacaulis sp. YBE204]
MFESLVRGDAQVTLLFCTTTAQFVFGLFYHSANAFAVVGALPNVISTMLLEITSHFIGVEIWMTNYIAQCCSEIPYVRRVAR